MRTAATLLVVLLLAGLAYSMLIMPGVNFGLPKISATLPSGVSRCGQLSVKMASKVTELCSHLFGSWGLLLADLKEIWRLVKSSMWVCLFSL